METHLSIRHVTRYRYSAPVRESTMQLYMQPRSEGQQILRSFQITTQPRAQLFAYSDYLGNSVYHFDIPQEHQALIVDVESAVEMMPRMPLPQSVSTDSWALLDKQKSMSEHFDMLLCARATAHSTLLSSFMAEQALLPDQVRRAEDPMGALRRLSRVIRTVFAYDPEATDVESTIDQALENRRGVCQDFTHIMLAIARSWGIPARYVSGYLYHSANNTDRSTPDASHAWVEAFLPSLGWIGFDPTNDLIAAERHIRVAIGRDYADVPPSKGVFKGLAQSDLAVAVRVTPRAAPERHEDFLHVVRPMRTTKPASEDAYEATQAQQQ